MILIILLYSFAIWYVAFVLTQLDGPHKLLSKVRDKFDSDWSPLSCIYCTIFWVSLTLCFIEELTYFYIFALAGIASFIHQIFERLDQ